MTLDTDILSKAVLPEGLRRQVKDKMQARGLFTTEDLGLIGLLSIAGQYLANPRHSWKRFSERAQQSFDVFFTYAPTWSADDYEVVSISQKQTRFTVKTRQRDSGPWDYKRIQRTSWRDVTIDNDVDAVYELCRQLALADVLGDLNALAMGKLRLFKQFSTNHYRHKQVPFFTEMIDLTTDQGGAITEDTVQQCISPLILALHPKINRKIYWLFSKGSTVPETRRYYETLCAQAKHI